MGLKYLEMFFTTVVFLVFAFSCFSSHLSNNTSGLNVLLGSQTLLTSSPYTEIRAVAQIINHPSFNRNTFDSDISLVKLSSPVNFNRYLLPVCLAASNSSFYKGTTAWATGWGVTESGCR